MADANTEEDRPPGPGPDAQGEAAEGGTPTLEVRVERLERLVEGLVGERGASPGVPPSPPTPAHDPSPGGDAPPPPAPGGSAAPHPPRPPDVVRSRTDWLRRGEDWVGRVGAVLLFLGLAFLYRYAVDRGWVTPGLRVGFGLLVGGTLLVLGLSRTRTRPRYSQVLLGGGVAVLYLTGWAAQALYGLVPWWLGFSWMVAVTVLALALAGSKGHQVLAVLGAGGGLATPLVLDSPPASVVGLVAYGTVILAWSGLLQLRRGWGVLLTVNVVGGLTLMGLAAGEAGGLQVWSAQWGLVWAWVVACAFPWAQGRLHVRRPDAWPPPPAPGARRVGDKAAWSRRSAVLWLLGVVASTVAVLFTANLWDLERGGIGIGFLVAAGVLLSASRMLEADVRLAGPALGSGAVLLFLGTALSMGREWMFFPLALEAAVLLRIASARRLPLLAALAHTVFGLLAVDFLGRLSSPAEGPITPYALGALGAMGVAAGTAVLVLRGNVERRVYLLASHAAFLAWLVWRLAPLPGGQGIASAAWGVSAVVLLGVGVATGRRSLRFAGLATLAAVALKLILVDLSTLDAGLRILIFLGFGGLFLVLGHLLKGGDADVAEAAEVPGEVSGT